MKRDADEPPRYAIGVDLSSGEDRTVTTLAERLPDGRVRLLYVEAVANDTAREPGEWTPSPPPGTMRALCLAELVRRFSVADWRKIGR